MNRHEADEIDDTKRFLRSWAWKREHRSDRARFRLPYNHTVCNSATGKTHALVVKQEKFAAEGFASTVWDSSIVVAKYFEKIQDRLRGKRCLDLSAGCGLVGIVLAKLGADVTATDLGPNLQLLRENCNANGAQGVKVREHAWGEFFDDDKFDMISACDVMYIDEAVYPLMRSLKNFSRTGSTVIVAYGRNRPAEEKFLQLCQGLFTVAEITSKELDSVYQCLDVKVIRLQRTSQAL